MNHTKLNNAIDALKKLSDAQFSLVESIINQFSTPYLLKKGNPSSDIVNDDVLRDFGDTLRIHHIFSQEPFTKDKFEYAFVKVLIDDGVDALMAPKGNPGNDIIINKTPVSLKTQADKSIKANKIHISKFMELGKGQWTDNPEDLIGLRDSFLKHMESYDRIFTLRCLNRGPEIWTYELVEIPKNLLQESQFGVFKMMINSSQFPKPGYCDILDASGFLKFQLYFDGGTERKLQIKNIAIENCLIHGTWSFEIYKEPEILD